MIKEILGNLIATKSDEIESWFAELTNGTDCSFYYNSVDVRNSGHKIVPVDTNIFPGGFNNLSSPAVQTAITYSEEFLNKYFSHAKKIAIVAENHTKNAYYLEHLLVLKDILESKGREVRITNLSGNTEKLLLGTSGNRQIEIDSLNREINKIVVGEDNFQPDLIIVNNDLTSGLPDILNAIEQKIIPPTGMGWYRRRKSHHFEAYNNIVTEFAQKFSIDPFFLTAEFYSCGEINFDQKKGMECVANSIDELIARLKIKYAEKGIKHEPYVFIKSDMGTYGMGIMTARSGAEILSMNREVRKKMGYIKSGEKNNEIVVQEGIPTIDMMDGNPAEPVVYLVNKKPVGIFYRLNTKKDNLTNLNSTGMMFKPVEDMKASIDLKVYQLVSRLACVAAIRECMETN